MRLESIRQRPLTEMASFLNYRQSDAGVAFYASQKASAPTLIILPMNGDRLTATQFTAVHIRARVGEQWYKQLRGITQRGGVHALTTTESLFVRLWEAVMPMIGIGGELAMKRLLGSGGLELFPQIFKVVQIPTKAKLFHYLSTQGMSAGVFKDYFGSVPEKSEEHAEQIDNASVYFPANMRPKRKQMLRQFLHTAHEILQRNGLGHLFAGQIVFTPLRGKHIGNWHPDTGQMRIKPDTTNDRSNLFTLLHEYGHKFLDTELGGQEAVKGEFIRAIQAGHHHERLDLLRNVRQAAEEIVKPGLRIEKLGRNTRGMTRGASWEVVRVIPWIDKDTATKRFQAARIGDDGRLMSTGGISGPVVGLLDRKTWKLLNPDRVPPELPDLSDIGGFKARLTSDKWFPTPYSETNADEWWAELFAIYMLGNLHGEPAEFVRQMLSRAPASIREQYEYDDYDEQDDWEPETAEIPVGEELYHGTQVPYMTWDEREDSNDTPFWVSNAPAVAERFSGWNEWDSGRPAPRIIAYVAAKPLRLLKLTSRADFIAVEEYWGFNTDDIHEFAEDVCAKGYDGWIVPNNYGHDQHDIMICSPYALEYKATRLLGATKA